MSKYKEFWFEIKGKINAKNGDDATSKIWELLNNKVEKFQITELDEAE